MTYNEAMAALQIAPADVQRSDAFPHLTRLDAVRIICQRVESIGQVISIPPSIARDVARVTQDCADPVDLHFAYGQAGKISVGWNKEEVLIRKGLAPRFDVEAYKREVERKVKLHADIFAQFAPMGASNSNHPIGPSPYQPLSAEDCAALELAALLGQAAAKANANTPPKPTPTPIPAKPAPDPSSPKFVLKRPKV